MLSATQYPSWVSPSHLKSVELTLNALCWRIVFTAAEFGLFCGVCQCVRPLCVCVCTVLKCHVVIFPRPRSRLSKPGSAYIWMNREMEYTVSIWLRRPLTKGAGKAEWQWKLCGFVPHKAHPEGPTSSWNFKQSGAHAEVPSPLESWREMEAFFFFSQVTYIFSEWDADWRVFFFLIPDLFSLTVCWTGWKYKTFPTYVRFLGINGIETSL